MDRIYESVAFTGETIFALLNPWWWPRWFRRAYLLTFPVMVPLHLCFWVIAGAIMLLSLGVVAAVDGVIKFWNGGAD